MNFISTFDCSSPAAAEAAASDIIQALVRDGVVKLEGVCLPEQIDAWRKCFEQMLLLPAMRGDYPYRLSPVGGGRTHFNLEIQKEFNKPEFYAIPVVYELVRRLLDDNFFLVTSSVVYAEPGAVPQGYHRDQLTLFPGHKINGMLPASSFTVSIPLVDTDRAVGGTEFLLGSHRWTEPDEESMYLPSIGTEYTVKLGKQAANPAKAGAHGLATQPCHVTTKKGDCVIWDTRVVHRGRANIGAYPRPMALLYYQRQWLFNFPMYEKDIELKITDSNLARVPQEYRGLFEWARKIWPAPQYTSDEEGYCSCGSGLFYKDCHA